MGRRWYSQAQEAESKKEETVEEPSKDAPKTSQTPPEEPAKEDPVQNELEAKKKEVTELTVRPSPLQNTPLPPSCTNTRRTQDRLKRTAADYRNLQDQTKREMVAARDFALQRFAKDLLDSIDNLDRALANVPAEKLSPDNAENADLVNLHDGLRMTEKILMATLQKHGLERFDPTDGEGRFDPNRHEAVFQAPQAGVEDGRVFFTQQKGFLLNGRVLRAAKVGVVKNS